MTNLHKSLPSDQLGCAPETRERQRISARALANVAICLTLGLLAQQSSLAAPDKRIQVDCNGYRVQIICGHSAALEESNSHACNMNTLQFDDGSGKLVVAAPPPIAKKFSDNKRPVMLSDTTPDQLSCVRARNGSYYVQVRYSRGSNSFTNEMFYDWFKPDGTRLTSVGVPLSANFQNPIAGINWKQLPKPISIEGE